MMESVPSMAPRSPPETGASSISTSCAASCSAIARVGPGSIVLMSITSDPAAAPAATPSSPSITCSTSGVSGSIVMTTSDAPATSAGDVARAGAVRDQRVDGSRAARVHRQREPRREEMAAPWARP